MKTAQKNKRKGLTLVEVMVTMLVIVVAVIGASGFRYYATLDARKADTQITAARLGLLLLEGWKGLAGNPEYDPADEFASDLDIKQATTDFSVVSGITSWKGYTITTPGGGQFYAALAYKDATDTVPALLTVSVAGLDERQDKTVLLDPVRLTTYVDN